jgi:hypothetical protein
MPRGKGPKASVAVTHKRCVERKVVPAGQKMSRASAKGSAPTSASGPVAALVPLAEVEFLFPWGAFPGSCSVPQADNVTNGSAAEMTATKSLAMGRPRVLVS